MTTATTTIDLWVCIDQAGDIGIGHGEDGSEEARQHYADNIGDLSDAEGHRMVRVRLTIPLPEVAVIELTASAPVLDAATATVS